MSKAATQRVAGGGQFFNVDPYDETASEAQLVDRRGPATAGGGFAACAAVRSSPTLGVTTTMKIPLDRMINRLPKGYCSSLGFGVVAFVSVAFLLTVFYWALRPFVWAAIYGVPYVSPPGPYSPLSGEWLFVQIIWFISAVFLGRTVCRLSGTKTRRVLLTLAVLWLVLTVAGEPNTGAEGWRLALHYLQVPLGVGFGYLLSQGCQSRAAG